LHGAAQCFDSCWWGDSYGKRISLHTLVPAHKAQRLAT
jgi:hypothetical protein